MQPKYQPKGWGLGTNLEKIRKIWKYIKVRKVNKEINDQQPAVASRRQQSTEQARDQNGPGLPWCRLARLILYVV
jgi:hypothetical protein